MKTLPELLRHELAPEAAAAHRHRSPDRRSHSTFAAAGRMMRAD
jgi:hypothetical protein